MKKFVTAAMLCLAAASFSYAQCDKKVIIKASKTEYLAPDSSVQRSVEEQSEIMIDKSSITIIPGSEEKKMSGTVNSYTCNFTIPYKDGVMVLKASMSNSGGESRDVTITITSKEGKTSFLAQVDGKNDRRIRLAADSFEESK
jgi:hypothetical protein